MRITKYGHSCLLIEEGALKALTDPGNWNETPAVEELDVILITHEHADHMDREQIKSLLAKSPSARVVSHRAVATLLTDEGIACEIIEHGQTIEVKGVTIESCGTKHAYIYGDMPQCQNTGFLIGERLFVTGDALHDVPGKPVEILALPTGGPWMRISEAIDYAKQVKPSVVIPVHDAMYVETYREGLIPRIVGGNLEAAGIAFRNMGPGSIEEF